MRKSTLNLCVTSLCLITCASCVSGVTNPTPKIVHSNPVSLTDLKRELLSQREDANCNAGAVMGRDIHAEAIAASPIVRIPGSVPPRATHTGICQFDFNVNVRGEVSDIYNVQCNDYLFARPTYRAVARWKYAPAKRADGRVTGHCGLQSRMTFLLADEQGTRIDPLWPDGVEADWYTDAIVTRRAK